MDLELADAPAKVSQCKGLLFRVRESRFMSASSGAIVHKREYVPLKRKSCQGCGECGWIVDDLREREFVVIDGGKDGDIVSIHIANICRDWETGYIDDCDLKFSVVKP
jgi:hypothetical protein